jgi:hypothetical protein
MKEDVITDGVIRVAIDRKTAIVVSQVEHIPLKKCLGSAIESRVPFRIAEIKKSERNNPSFNDITGAKRGWLTVIGKSADFPGLWSCRCNCGVYVLRKQKAINNEKNDFDRCQECRHKLFLKREDCRRRTGRNYAIQEFA